MCACTAAHHLTAASILCSCMGLTAGFYCRPSWSTQMCRLLQRDLRRDDSWHFQQALPRLMLHQLCCRASSLLQSTGSSCCPKVGTCPQPLACTAWHEPSLGCALLCATYIGLCMDLSQHGTCTMRCDSVAAWPPRGACVTAGSCPDPPSQVFAVSRAAAGQLESRKLLYPSDGTIMSLDEAKHLCLFTGALPGC